MGGAENGRSVWKLPHATTAGGCGARNPRFKHPLSQPKLRPYVRGARRPLSQPLPDTRPSPLIATTPPEISSQPASQPVNQPTRQTDRQSASRQDGRDLHGGGVERLVHEELHPVGRVKEVAVVEQLPPLGVGGGRIRGDGISRGSR